MKAQPLLTALEVEFLQGPFQSKETDIRIQPQLDHLFDVIDADNNNRLDVREFSLLVQACTGCKTDSALHKSTRFFNQLRQRELSRTDFYVYFHNLFGTLPTSKEVEDAKEGLQDLTKEVYSIHHNAHLNCFTLLQTSSLLQGILSLLLCAGSALSLSRMTRIDSLYLNVATEEDIAAGGIFFHSFSHQTTTAMVIAAGLSMIIGGSVFASPSDRNLERMSLRCMSSTSVVLSLVLLALTTFLYIFTADGETMCHQKCSSVCESTFPSVNQTDDFNTCQTLVSKGNCTCGFSVLHGAAPDVQSIIMTSDNLDTMVTLTFEGYTTFNISFDANGTDIEHALSRVILGKNNSVGSEYGPVVVNVTRAASERRRRQWDITFSNAFFDAEKILVGGLDKNSVVSTEVLQQGREHTKFEAVEDLFSGIAVDVVAAFGFACSAACFLTGCVGAFLSCRNKMCSTLKHHVQFGGVEHWTAEQRQRITALHERLRMSFDGGTDGGEVGGESKNYR